MAVKTKRQTNQMYKKSKLILSNILFRFGKKKVTDTKYINIIVEKISFCYSDRLRLCVCTRCVNKIYIF